MTIPKPSPLRGPMAIRAFMASIAMLLIVLVVPAGVASAHTSFEQSTPSNGATISEPVAVLVLQFTGVSEPSDDGFTVLTPDGQVRTPTSVATVDQKVFELTFDPPLAGGEIGVRWSVSAPDAHPIDGVFSFTVTAPAPVLPAATEASPVVAAGSSPAAEATPVAGDPSLVAAADSSNVMASADDSIASSPSTSLDDFLADRPVRSGGGAARWGRLIELASLTLLIGGAAFAATTLRGRRAEIERAILLLRILGVSLAVGALLEYVGVARIAQESILGYWSAQPGLATLLRGIGGLAIAAGLAAITMPVMAPTSAHSLSAAVNQATQYEREERARFWPDDTTRPARHRPEHRIDDNARSAVKAVSIDPLLDRPGPRMDEPTHQAAGRSNIIVSTTPPLRPTQPVQTRRQPTTRDTEDRPAESHVIRRWVLDRSSTAAGIGVTVAILSFWFDGHTVSKGPRLLHAVINSVHVVAGSVWVGGVVAMAVVLWTRHRGGVAPRALEMVVRFSTIATFALGAVLAAGGIMAIMVLDSVGELFSTQWGQVLMLKSAAAGLAMIGGAYNHFRLLPALEADPDDPRLVEHLRSAVTAEAILLGFVVVVTSSLVAAAS